MRIRSEGPPRKGAQGYFSSSQEESHRLQLRQGSQEGKINFYAQEDGVLKVDTEKLLELNMLGEISFATLPDNIPVKKRRLSSRSKGHSFSN